MVLSAETFNQSVRTEYSEAVNARYTFQPLWVSDTIQYSLFNEVDVIKPMSYLTYGLHNSTKYTYKTMPNQQYTTYYKRN